MHTASAVGRRHSSPDSAGWKAQPAQCCAFTCQRIFWWFLLFFRNSSAYCIYFLYVYDIYIYMYIWCIIYHYRFLSLSWLCDDYNKAIQLVIHHLPFPELPEQPIQISITQAPKSIQASCSLPSQSYPVGTRGPGCKGCKLYSWKAMSETMLNTLDSSRCIL